MNTKTIIVIPIIFILILSAMLTDFAINFEEKVFNDQSKKIEKKQINIAKNGGGFLEYVATINPKTQKPDNKISFIKEIKRRIR